MRHFVIVLAAALWAIAGETFAAEPFLATGAVTATPPGWAQFCRDNPAGCDVPVLPLVTAKMTPKRLVDLSDVNRMVNIVIKPRTDQEHWGVEERWNYPDDGFGDCEDYVLQKRELLIGHGWPRQALLVTVVRDLKGEGHAVLTVRTDQGDLILDNMRDEILLWSQTGYRFVKRQSQSDPNVWVTLVEPPASVGSAR